MVSIGVSLLLFSLIPLILCTNEGFLKINDTENEKRQLECGHLKKFVEGTSSVPNKPVGSWISPHHFITSITSVTHNKNYKDMECETRGNMVTQFYESKAKFAAKVVGTCHKEGVVLVDTHAEYDKPHEKFFCLKEKTPKPGDLVNVVNSKGVKEPGAVVDCPDPKKKSVFCVTIKKGMITGHVFSKDKENYSLIGVTLGHVDKNILEVFSLAEHHHEICETTGVCNTHPSKRLPVQPPTPPPVVTTKPTVPTVPTVPTTNTTVATEPTTSEVSPSTDTPSTKAAEKTTTSEDVKEVTTTVTVIGKEKLTTKTENKTDAATTEITGDSKVTTEAPIQDPSTQKPEGPSPKPPVIASVESTSSGAPTAEPEPTTIPDTLPTEPSPGSQPSLPLATSVTTATAPGAPDSKQNPHAEALTDFSDIDCEKENLCFDEDIFASASANGGIILIICVALVLMGF